MNTQVNPRTIAIAILAAIVAFGVFAVLRNPVRAERAQFMLQMAQLAAPGFETGADEGVDFAAMRGTLGEKPALWEPLVAPPETVEPPPDLKAMLEGVVAKRAQMGSGEDLRVLIVQPDNPRGEYYRVGETIRGCTVKAIEDEAVVLAQMHNGTEYTVQLPRQR